MKKILNPMHHGNAEFGGLSYFCNQANDQSAASGRFGRMFHDLPGLYTDPEILEKLGGLAGPMDGGTGTNPSATIDVGHVFFGQFVDHDVTLDTSSSLTQVNRPSDIVNVRTPTLDLDCIYGDGPEGSPYLYFDHIYVVTGANGTATTAPNPINQSDAHAKLDLSRAPNGRALIGDPRNDENRILSQVQLAFHNFHNEVVNHVKSTHDIDDEIEIFETARAIVTAHYHWALIYDFLPKICGADIVWDILHRGRKFYCTAGQPPFIPVEFSVAGFRFGHTLVPQTIQAQQGGSRFSLFGSKFGRGFSPLSDDDAKVDMFEMFAINGSGRTVQRSEKMDSKLASTLLNLPSDIASNPSSLATRNLLRGQSFMLPSGEAISTKMGIDAAIIDQVSDAANTASGGTLKGCTPLWYYMMMEAEVIGRADDGISTPGEGLGPMGGRLVAEVIIGLMELDSRSFLASNRSWQPADGLGENIQTVGDMLTYTA